MAEIDLARSPWSTARSTARSSAAGDEPKQAYSPVTGLALNGRPAPRRAKSTPRRRGKGTRQGVPGFTGRKVFNTIQITPKVGEIFSVAESEWLAGDGVTADANAEVAEPCDLQAQLLKQLSPRRPSRTTGHPFALDLRTQIAAEGVAIAQAAAAGGAANDVAAAPMPAVLIPRAPAAAQPTPTPAAPTPPAPPAAAHVAYLANNEQRKQEEAVHAAASDAFWNDDDDDEC